MAICRFSGPTARFDILEILQNELRLRFQTSYVGGKERARHLLQDAPENDSVAARGAESWPFEGSRVPQHDFIFWNILEDLEYYRHRKTENAKLHQPKSWVDLLVYQVHQPSLT